MIKCVDDNAIVHTVTVIRTGDKTLFGSCYIVATARTRDTNPRNKEKSRNSTRTLLFHFDSTGNTMTLINSFPLSCILIVKTRCESLSTTEMFQAFIA